MSALAAAAAAPAPSLATSWPDIHSTRASSTAKEAPATCTSHHGVWDHGLQHSSSQAVISSMVGVMQGSELHCSLIYTVPMCWTMFCWKQFSP